MTTTPQTDSHLCYGTDSASWPMVKADLVRSLEEQASAWARAANEADDRLKAALALINRTAAVLDREGSRDTEGDRPPVDVLANHRMAELDRLRAAMSAATKRYGDSLQAWSKDADYHIAHLSRSLRSLISTLETVDSDERYYAEQESRSAHVHTGIIREARAVLDDHGSGD